VLLQAGSGRGLAPRTVPTGVPDVPGAATPFLWVAAVLGLGLPGLAGRLRALPTRR